jgi:sterol desaturase/sphingolipid hydroxylase (fatty acid hydroxylase superfamily)
LLRCRIVFFEDYLKLKTMNLSTNLLLYAIPVFIMLSIIEAILLYKESRSKEIKKDFVISATLGLGFICISLITKGIILFCYGFIYEYRLFQFNNSIYWAWVICFIADDFTYYWFHRISHTVRFFWASHIVHHSSSSYSLSAALRQTWTGNITGTFLFWGWMPLFGFEPATVLIIKSISIIYQFWLHTEKINKMPFWFEMVLNTPSHHRVHHGSNDYYIDKNFGGTLIIWDKLFGSYTRENTKPVYGLSNKTIPLNVFKIAFCEWKDIITDLKNTKHRKNYSRYLLNKPNWKENKGD